jgi:hypothetical protein
MVAAIEQMMPSATQRRVAVIGDTSWTSGGKPSLEAASQAIPFFGLLMGLAASAIQSGYSMDLPICLAMDVAVQTS